MFEVKRKLLTKLKKIVSRRKSFKKWRFNETSSEAFSFTDNAYEALEEVRQMLGFSKEKLDTMLALLGKSEDGHFNFDLGDITIGFHAVKFDESASSEITFSVELTENEFAYRREYEIRHTFLQRSGSNVD